MSVAEAVPAPTTELATVDKSTPAVPARLQHIEPSDLSAMLADTWRFMVEKRYMPTGPVGQKWAGYNDTVLHVLDQYPVLDDDAVRAKALVDLVHERVWEGTNSDIRHVQRLQIVEQLYRMDEALEKAIGVDVVEQTFKSAHDFVLKDDGTKEMLYDDVDGHRRARMVKIPDTEKVKPADLVYITNCRIQVMDRVIRLLNLDKIRELDATVEDVLTEVHEIADKQGNRRRREISRSQRIKLGEVPNDRVRDARQSLDRQAIEAIQRRKQKKADEKAESSGGE